MMISIQHDDGEIVELPVGTKIFIDLSIHNALVLDVDQQDTTGVIASFNIKSAGKPYAKIVNDEQGSHLLVGIKE